MNSAIIFIKNEYELNLAKSLVLGKMLIDYTLRELNRLDLDKIFLCGTFDFEIKGVSSYANIKEIIISFSKSLQSSISNTSKSLHILYQRVFLWTNISFEAFTTLWSRR